MANPELEFKVVRRLPNQNEVLLGTYAVAADFNNQQAVRQATYDFVKAQTVNNPAWRIIIYGPTNGGPYTADDIIWDSSINLDPIS